jgi:RNA polymerase sigma factor (sigma-70 family)
MESDQDLLQKYREAGDREALDALFRRYVDRVFRLTRRLLHNDAEADDATQVAFTAALKGLTGLRDPNRFASWLFGIAVRVARKSIRSAVAEARRRVEAGDRVEISREPSMKEADLLAALKAVEELPEEYRLPVLLYHCDGLSYEEIAAALEMPRGTVGTNIHRGLDRLRTALTGVSSVATLVTLLGSIAPSTASATTVEAVSRLARTAPIPDPPLKVSTSGRGSTARLKLSLGVILGAGLLVLFSLGIRQWASDKQMSQDSGARANLAPKPFFLVPEPQSHSASDENRSPSGTPVPPPSEDPLSPHEREASANLKMLSTAEADFRANDRDENKIHDFWTGDVSGLYLFERGPEGRMLLQMIPYEVARADAAPLVRATERGPLTPRRSHAGYWYKMLPVASSRDNRSLREFAIAAYPAEYGDSGRRTFVINENNNVYWKDLKGGAPGAWPSEEELRTWKDVVESRASSEEALPVYPEMRERFEAEVARNGFDFGDLDARLLWDHNNERRASLREILQLDVNRWTMFRSAHERLLEQAKRLENQKARIHGDGEQTVIEIPAFPQEGLVLLTEWTRELESLLPSEKKREFDSLWGDILFPLGLGQRAVKITLERFGELVRVEEHVTLANGEELVATRLTDSKEIPGSCRHLIR